MWCHCLQQVSPFCRKHSSSQREQRAGAANQKHLACRSGGGSSRNETVSLVPSQVPTFPTIHLKLTQQQALAAPHAQIQAAWMQELCLALTPHLLLLSKSCLWFFTERKITVTKESACAIAWGVMAFSVYLNMWIIFASCLSKTCSMGQEGGRWEKENPPALLQDEFGFISRAVGDGREQQVLGQRGTVLNEKRRGLD